MRRAEVFYENGILSHFCSRIIKNCLIMLFKSRENFKPSTTTVRYFFGKFRFQVGERFGEDPFSEFQLGGDIYG